MAKDFRAGQIRTTQIIASGSTTGAPSLLIVSASGPGVDYDGSGINNSTLLSNVGADVFVFISGSSGSMGTTTPGATLFGGDLVVSGIFYSGDGIAYSAGAHPIPGGSDTHVQFNGEGVLAGDSGLTYTSGTQLLYVQGGITSLGSLVVEGSYIALSGTIGAGEQGVQLYAATGGIDIDAAENVSIGSSAGVDISAGGAISFEAGNNSNITTTSGYLLLQGESSVAVSGSIITMSTFGGPGTGFIQLNSNDTTFGIEISTGIANVPVKIGHTTSETTVNDNLNVTGDLDVTGSLTVGPGQLYATDATLYGDLNVEGDVLIITDLIINGSILVDSSLSVTGSITGKTGLSGSLTQLSDGSSYLIAGSNITITSASNGAVTIEAPGDSFWSSDVNNSIYTTGSIIVAGSSGYTSGLNVGEDTLNFITGVMDSKGGMIQGVTVFGGDVAISGTLYGGSPLKIGTNIQLTGSIESTAGLSGSLTQLSDGSSYLIAGSNITITSASNGAVTIEASGGSSSFWSSEIAGNTYITGSVLLAGNSGFTEASQAGSDVSNYFHGAVGSKDGVTGGVSLFEGDIVASGTIYGGYDVILTTNLLTLGSQVVKIASGMIAPTDIGLDTSLFVSGAIGSKDGVNRGASKFGGDVIIAGGLTATTGLSGSLQKLADGSSYLIAGSNITITSATNGAVTIAAAAGGSTFWNSAGPGNIYTTGTIVVAGASGYTTPGNVGTDVSNYIYGTVGSKGGATGGVSVFAGDIVVSGSLNVEGAGGTHHQYGGLYIFGNAAEQGLTGGVETIVNWDAIGGMEMSGSSNVTADLFENGVYVPAGTYLVSFQTSISGTDSATYTLRSYLDGAPQNQIRCQKKFGTGGNIDSCSASGIVVVPTSNALISLWVNGDTTTVTFVDCQLVVRSL